MCTHAQHRQTYTLAHIHTLHRNTSKTTDLYTDINAYTPQRHTTNTHRNTEIDTDTHTHTHTPQKHYRNRHTHTHKHTHRRNTLQKHRHTDTHIYTYTVVYLCFLKIEKYSLLDREGSLLSCSYQICNIWTHSTSYIIYKTFHKIIKNNQLLERGEFLVNLPESGVGSAGFVSCLPNYLWVTSYLYVPTNNTNKLLSSFWVTCEFFF